MLPAPVFVDARINFARPSGIYFAADVTLGKKIMKIFIRSRWPRNNKISANARAACKSVPVCSTKILFYDIITGGWEK